MRNLKRALSLGLTAAMISGLMVMGSSAASYADVTSEDNQEAIEVLEAVGIMIGDENGNFNPDQNVTRNEMAVVMSNLMEYNVASYKDTSPFTDVPSWAEPYVAACWTNGITAGYSDTIYGGSDTVTTAQAALMLMKALGYFQYSQDFGADWQLATVKQGNNIDLFVGVDSGVTAPMTRDDVAQLVLNTLEAGTVTASTDGSWSIGDVTIVNNVKYDYVTSGQPYATAIDDRETNNDGDLINGYVVELGEQLYMGDLKLNDHDSDDFMRPSRTWSYDGAEIGTYVKKDLIVATYTEGVTGRELYDLLTSATIKEYGFKAYLNGSQNAAKLGDNVIVKEDLKRSNNDDLDQTGTGVLTEVFLDLDTKEITVTSIDTWLARANSDYNENSETLSVRIYDQNTSGSTGKTEVLDLDEIPAIEGVAKDQYLLVNRTLKDRTDYETVVVSEPEILTNVDVTKFSTVANSDTDESLFESLTAEGNPYDAADEAHYNEDVLNLYDNSLLTDNTYNVYLDPYGNAIGVDLYEGTMNYVFIAGYDRTGSNIAINTADAAAIFLDGTMDVIKVNVTATDKNMEDRDHKGQEDPDYAAKYTFWSDDKTGRHQENRWYTYTVSNDVYTLRPVKANEMLVTDYAIPANDTEVINCSNVWVADDTAPHTRGYGNDDSVYITAEAGNVENSKATNDAITDVTGLYTGVQNVDIEMTDDSKGNVPEYIYTVIDDDEYIIASIVLGEAQGSVENYAYILEAPTSEEKLSDGTYVWEFDVIMGGVKQTLQARSKYQDVIHELDAGENTVMELRFDADEYVTGVDTIPDGTNGTTDKIADFYVTNGMENYEVFDHNTNGKPDINLNLTGRTLQMESEAGLTFISDAPTALKQTVNGKSVTTEYASVQDAYNDLGDADPDTAGLQFDGRIVAVLNSQGVAEWAYIISDTPINSNDQGGTVKPPVTGEEWGIYTTVAEVNAALKNGNVIINGDWQPTDYKDNTTVTIPANRTLKINGSFDAEAMGLIINAANSTSRLVVTGDYDATPLQQINYQVEANTMTIRTGTATPAQTVNVTADVNVTDKLTARGTGDIVISAGTTVSAKDLDIVSGDAVEIINYGTLKWTGTNNVPTTDLKGNSLYGGSMTAKLTIGGTVDGTNYEGYAEVEDISNAADVVVNNGELVVNGEFEAKSVTGTAGGQITFDDNATVGKDAGKGVADKFTNGTATVTDVAGETFTFNSSEDAFVNEDIDVTEVTLTAAAWWDRTTASSAGVPSNWFVWKDKNGYNCFEDETFAKNVAENPSVYVTAELAKGLELAEGTTLEWGVEIDGKSFNVVPEGTDKNITFREDGSLRFGFHILENDNEALSDTDATSIQKGDTITVTLTLKQNENTQTFTAQCIYGGESIDRDASASV